jgi:hypothetical protein
MCRTWLRVRQPIGGRKRRALSGLRSGDGTRKRATRVWRRERAGAEALILMGNLTRRLETRRSPDSSPGLPPTSTNARHRESLEDRNPKNKGRQRRSAAATQAKAGWRDELAATKAKASGPKGGPELQGVCSHGCSAVRFADSSDGDRKSTARNGCAT